MRPAVEAGEKLGFLPGDLQEKVDPYLRPLYDALFDLVDYERVERLLEKRVNEIAPLAFMRGRTLSDAFVILDEAQNTTSEQMKMFLTRIGFGSKAVITGDVTQIDLPTGKRSGLVEAGTRALGRRRYRVCLFQRERRGPSQTGPDDHQGLRVAYQEERDLVSSRPSERAGVKEPSLTVGLLTRHDRNRQPPAGI